MTKLKELPNRGKNMISCCSTGIRTSSFYTFFLTNRTISDRKTIPAEEQEKIFAEVHSQLQQQELKRKVRRRRGPSEQQ